MSNCLPFCSALLVRRSILTQYPESCFLLTTYKCIIFEILKVFPSDLWQLFGGLNIVMNTDFFHLLFFFQSTIFPAQITNEHESLIMVKKLFATSISCITYLRGLFPESSYRDRHLDGNVELNDCFGFST